MPITKNLYYLFCYNLYGINCFEILSSKWTLEKNDESSSINTINRLKHFIKPLSVDFSSKANFSKSLFLKFFIPGFLLKCQLLNIFFSYFKFLLFCSALFTAPFYLLLLLLLLQFFLLNGFTLYWFSSYLWFFSLSLLCLPKFSLFKLFELLQFLLLLILCVKIKY